MIETGISHLWMHFTLLKLTSAGITSTRSTIPLLQKLNTNNIYTHAVPSTGRPLPRIDAGKDARSLTSSHDNKNSSFLKLSFKIVFDKVKHFINQKKIWINIIIFVLMNEHFPSIWFQSIWFQFSSSFL